MNRLNASIGAVALLEGLDQCVLERLDAAIDRAWTTEEFTDEINTPLPRTEQR